MYDILKSPLFMFNTFIHLKYYYVKLCKDADGAFIGRKSLLPFSLEFLMLGDALCGFSKTRVHKIFSLDVKGYCIYQT